MKHRIAEWRLKRARYVIRDGRGRYLTRHYSGEWRWTTVKADARVFRNIGSARSRAALMGGTVETYKE